MHETFVLFKLSSDISSYIRVSTQTEEEYKEWARNRQEVAQSQIFKKSCNLKSQQILNFTPNKNVQMFYLRTLFSPRTYQQ